MFIGAVCNACEMAITTRLVLYFVMDGSFLAWVSKREEQYTCFFVLFVHIHSVYCFSFAFEAIKMTD